MKDTLIRKYELVEILKLSDTRITELFKEGIIVKEELKYPLIKNVQNYINYLRAVSGKKDNKSLIDERRRLTTAQADLAERKVKEDEKIFIRADEYEEAAFEKGRQVRDAILNIPDRISAIIAAESDAKKTYEILRTELETALMELSTEST